MTSVTISTGDKDVVIETPQPVVPPTAPPVQIGLVEISQIVQRGSIWYTGSGAPVTDGGQVGDLYLNMDTGDVYRWDGDSWVFQGTFAPSTDTPAEVLAKLITVDGAGSLLDADTLDGHDSPYFATQTDMSAVQAKNTAQDSQITQNITDIANLQIVNSTQDTTISGKADKIYVDSQDALKANIASPTFTGDPKAPTASPGDSDTSIATTAFVSSAVSTAVAAGAVPPATVPPLMDGTAAVGVATKYAREDHKHPSDTAKIGDAPNDGVQYVRQSLAWSPVNVPPGTVVSDTAPASPQSGQMWLKSSTMVLYCWYVDPNTAQWVMVSASPQTVDQNYSRKTARRSNLIVNGALNVSQENGNTEGTVNGYYAADQFFSNFTGTGFTFGHSRVAAANPSGSQYRLQLRVTAAKASLAAGDNAFIQTRLEGLNAQDLNWGGAAPKDAVMQFGFNGPAGSYGLCVRNNASNYCYVANFTIAAGQALTDTLQTVKIPAPTTGVWPTDNTPAIHILISPAAGSTYIGVAGWQSGDFRGVTGMSNGLAAVQTFQVWDLYFGADPDRTGLAPTFEVSDYGTELAKCSRYFWTYSMMVAQASAGNYAPFSFPVPMRINPSVTCPAAGFAVGTISVQNGGWQQTTRASSQVTANARM